MFLQTAWQRITTSRRTLDREAAAQYEHVHREGVLRDEFARREHALEAQIAQAHAENCQLRAENRALLNSVLGIAGIPPVIVNDPPSSTGSPGAALPSGDNEHDHPGEAVAPNGTMSPSTSAGHSSAVPLQKDSRLTGATKAPNITAPIRRRSWHQIYRMLEFESSRRKDQNS